MSKNVDSWNNLHNAIRFPMSKIVLTVTVHIYLLNFKQRLYISASAFVTPNNRYTIYATSGDK